MWRVALDYQFPSFRGAYSKRELEANSWPIYFAHSQQVKQTVPNDQLLVYELGSGWGPICDFLGKPVPGVPFARVNETDMVIDSRQGLLLVGLSWAMYLIPCAVVVGACWWALRRKK